MNEKILLVEDEALIAMAKQQELAKYSYQTSHVTTGEKAIDLVCNQNAAIDLILMDIDLGRGIDGTETARQILENKEIPIVFLSSHEEREIVEKTEKITSYGYVVKSSSITVLDTSIKMAFRLFDANSKLKIELTERNRTEDALQKSEEKFKALFEKGPIGVAYHKMVYDDTGKAIDYYFLDANSSYLELTGVDPRGKCVTEAFPGIENDPFDWIGTFGNVAKTGEQIRFEQYLQPNDRWYDCVGYQIKPDHFVAAFVEITERRRAEKAPLDSEDKDRTIVENINYALVIHDFNGVISFVNDKVCRMLNYTRDELIGTSVVGLHSYDHRNLIKNVIQKSEWPDGELYEIEALNKNGELIPVEVSSTILSREGAGEIQSVARDISEQRRTEEMLLQKERQYRSIYNSLRDALIIVNANREVIDCNTAFTELFGYTLSEVKGKKTNILFASKDEYEQLGRMMQQQIKNSDFLYQPLYRTKTREIRGEKKIQYLKDDSGKPRGFI